MAKQSTTYVCTECGSTQPQWVGKCPSCGAWSTIEEKGAAKRKAGSVSLSSIEPGDAERVPSRIGEFDRVLGGGIVRGSLVLLAGDPGIGKSTIALQAAASFGTVLYAAGEESPSQIRLRADRLGVSANGVTVTTEPTIEGIIQEAESTRPGLIVVDSIQTVRTESPGGVGAVNQIRESAAVLLRAVKRLGIPSLVIGHVTKSGDIAGPMLLEHLVDVVLLLEQDTSGAYRMLRGLKNRFGGVDEVGLFAMAENGMKEVSNPSEILLPTRNGTSPGSAVTAAMEGRRPLVIELQALTVATQFGMPRRLATGIDPNRLAMLLAVIERRGGIVVSNADVYLNSAGGFRLKETAADLGAVAAVASAVLDRAIPAGTLFCGEVGLGGEVRPVGRLEARLREAARLGFKTAYVPRQKLESEPELELRPVEEIGEVLCAIRG